VIAVATSFGREPFGVPFVATGRGRLVPGLRGGRGQGGDKRR
jgi:hypothetical protein